MLHMISPASAMFLWFAATIIGFPYMRSSHVILPATSVVVSVILAFTLNLASFAFMKWSPALTLSVAGIIKDIVLVTAASVALDDHAKPTPGLFHRYARNTRIQ